MTASPRWSLTLYVSGASPRSTAAVEAVRRVCDEDLAAHFDLTVVNAADRPDLAKRDGILALPTLVKRAPAPHRLLVGDLTDAVRIRSGLGLDAQPPISATSTSAATPTGEP